MKGNLRLHHLLTIDLCPPLEVENAVISTTMASVGGIAWGEIKRVGKLKGDGDIEEAIEKKNWRTLVSVVDYIRALKMERAGVAVIASGDESYCHTLHHADQSYLLIGKENVSKHEVNCAVRDGLRICMQMFTTRWGPIALDDIVDCKFLNAAGDEDGPGARMKEMDQDGELRQVYRAAPRGVGEKPVSQMNKNQLRTKAIELGVSILAENGTTKLTKESLKKAIQAFRAIGRAEVADARAAKDRTGGLGGILTAEQKARQLIETDWEELFDQYKDCALTTIRFMIAYQHCGDYHDNYDHPMFFKHLVVLYLVYPRWCMQQQRKLEAGTLYPATIHPFFKWSNAEKTAGTPARQLCTFIDNAPYHHGGAANINSWSKKFLAEVLRSLDIASIPTTCSDGTSLRVEVPAKGVNWPHGHPNVEQVRQGAAVELGNKKPGMFQPPWQLLLDKADAEWGKGGGDNYRPKYHDEFLKWWKNHFTAPYTPTFWPVELMWAFGKNYVALPQNQEVGRTPSQTIKLLRDRFCRPDCADPGQVYDRQFKHCENQMNEWITVHHEQNNCQLHGTV